MRIRFAVWVVVLGLPLMAAGEDLTTLSGQTYSNVVVRRYDRQGIAIEHDGGTAKVFYKEILPELRGYYRKMAVDWTPESNAFGAKEEPAGSNDLATLSGRIYRNVEVKRVEEQAVQIAHDGGTAKVYFSEIPVSQRETYRAATPVPDVPPGPEDLVAADGQVFRHVEILLVEPDGLTFRHAGGVSKVRFTGLTKELQEKHGYDPQAALKFQRALAAEKRRAQQAEVERAAQEELAREQAAAERPISIFDLQTDRPDRGQYRIRFAVRNHTPKIQTIRAIPYDDRKRAVMGGRQIRIPANSGGKQVELLVPLAEPRRLTVYCGEYQTNRTLRW